MSRCEIEVSGRSNRGDNWRLTLPWAESLAEALHRRGQNATPRRGSDSLGSIRACTVPADPVRLVPWPTGPVQHSEERTGGRRWLRQFESENLRPPDRPTDSTGRLYTRQHELVLLHRSLRQECACWSCRFHR